MDTKQKNNMLRQVVSAYLYYQALHRRMSELDQAFSYYTDSGSLKTLKQINEWHQAMELEEARRYAVYMQSARALNEALEETDLIVYDGEAWYKTKSLAIGERSNEEVILMNLFKGAIRVVPIYKLQQIGR